MTKDYPGEEWKTLKFDSEFTNKGRIEVSNFGRLRTFNKVSDGNLINGSMINGYRVLKLKLYKARDEKIQKRFDYLQEQALKLARKLKSLKNNNENQKTIADTAKLLDTLKTNLSKKFKDDLKERTINYHSLVHRLVAVYFLKKPIAGQTIVAHLDHNKLNNRANNLQWMTPEQNYEHQKNSPYVIAEMQDRRLRRKENSRTTKLTVTKVMLLKKLLAQNKPMKQLVKIFKVTETQILRIKRGENWTDIEAAK
ncbi:MAG TPA: HNH endonuclease signature motif containing protein [Hanamia sp.]